MEVKQETCITSKIALFLDYLKYELHGARTAARFQYNPMKREDWEETPRHSLHCILKARRRLTSKIQTLNMDRLKNLNNI